MARCYSHINETSGSTKFGEFLEKEELSAFREGLSSVEYAVCVCVFGVYVRAHEGTVSCIFNCIILCCGNCKFIIYFFSLYSVLNQLNPVYTLIFDFFKTNSNIIHPSTSIFPK